MIWLFWVALGVAQESSDIEATRAFSGDAAAVMQVLSDVERLPALFPPTCTRKWDGKGAGIGSRFEVTYTMGWWKRRLEATVTRVDSHQGVEWEHHGRKGFITRWTVEPSEEGGLIRVKTWMQPPPWPFKRTYYRRIKPKWELCYRQALDVLVQQVGE